MITYDMNCVIYFLQGFSACLTSVVQTWGLHLKGPVYVSIFSPLSIVIAAAMSVMFLGDALHLGRYKTHYRSSLLLYEV